jgi:hypothetical protein
MSYTNTTTKTSTKTNPNTNPNTMGKITMVTWNDINETGVYVDTQYPRFYRVTDECLNSNGNPVIQCSNFTVAKISPNPSIPVGQIQTLCTTHNLPVAK